MMSDLQKIYFWEKRKKEKMIREQIQREVEIPEQVYRSAGKAFRMIAEGAVRQETEPRRKSAPLVLIPRLAGCMAAVLLVCVLANIVFPVQVRALPVVGSIFERIQKAVGYENLSEYAEPLVPEKEDGEAGRKDAHTEANGREDAHTKTNGGLTVSVSEIYADTEAIYLSMKMKSEEPFSKNFYYLKGAESKKIDGKIPMYLYGKTNYSFMKEIESDQLSTVNRQIIVEGLMVNENTFEFLWRIGLGNDLRWYQENEDQEAVLPKEFTLEIAVDQISSLISMDKVYIGPWDFQIPVKVDDGHAETVDVHETSETGAGLISVVKTPFEITTLAATSGVAGYKVVVLDAKGNKLPDVWTSDFGKNVSAGDIWTDSNGDVMHNKWLIDGNDVSSIEVFVLGKDFYENVYATGLWSGTDWEGNEDKPEEEKLGILLRKYAEYHKVINFDS